MSALPEGWDRLLNRPLDREPCRTALALAEQAAAGGLVYPPRSAWFAALDQTPPEQVRVVILGQDPYHEPGQAMGLAFSVPATVKLPPSLRNIFKELAADLDCPPPADGDLTPWARQGVLLLNTVLTVEAGKANSHRDLGWQALTEAVLTALGTLPQPIAFLLWGSQAQSIFDRSAALRQAGPRLVLRSAHPSPLSAYRGFFGSRPFSRINAFLRENGGTEIRWSDGPAASGQHES